MPRKPLLGGFDRGRLYGVIGLALFTVIIAGVTYAILERAYNNQEERAESSVVWKAEEAAWNIANYMEQRRTCVLITSMRQSLPNRVIQFRDGVDPEAETFLQECLDVEYENRQCTTVALFDSTGTAVVSSGEFFGDDEALADAVQAVARTGEPGSIESVIDDDGWYVWWFFPMISSSGETVVIGECVDIAPVVKDVLARHEASFGTGELVLLERDADGPVLSLCSDHGVSVTPVELCGGTRVVALGDMGNDGLEVLRVQDCVDREVLGAVVAVEGTEWRVMAKVLQAEIIDGVEESHWTALSVDLMIFAVAGMTVVMFERGRERRAEQAASLDQIRRALESQDRFLANVSHELRTPLNSIMGFTSILLSGLAGPLNDEQRKQLGMVDQSSKRLLALVNDVLDLSKLKSGKHPIIVSDFPASDIVREACDIMGPLSALKNLKCESGVPVQDVEMHTDREMVARVVLNLLSNAVKFTEEGFVSIDASYDERNDMVHFVVRDSGCGISEEELARVTEEFTQVVEPTGYKPVGTGLGLAISRRMAEALGGALMAESTIGEGSAFTFVVPRMYQGDGEIDI